MDTKELSRPVSLAITWLLLMAVIILPTTWGLDWRVWVGTLLAFVCIKAWADRKD